MNVKRYVVGIGMIAVVAQPLSSWSAVAATMVSMDTTRIESPRKGIVDDTKTNEYIQNLVQKSERLREERREERLQHYYKKNFSEYFDYTGGVSHELQDEIDQWKERAESIE